MGSEGCYETYLMIVSCSLADNCLRQECSRRMSYNVPTPALSLTLSAARSS